MKATVTFFFLILTGAISNAQVFYGTVRDSLNEPVAFANVVAKDSSGRLLAGTLTNDKGAFEIRQEGKPFLLTISFIGYRDWSLDVGESTAPDLGSITLHEQSRELENVVIYNSRPTIIRKVDRLEFNVENSILSAGGDAYDILQRTPGVRTDGDDIALIGKSSVRVMINDRISPLTGDDLVNFLKSLSSENVKKIEVITNPPAKYEAEGNSGLINIVLAKNGKRNLSGNVRSSYRMATYPTLFAGTGLNYQKDKLSVFGDVNSGTGSILVNEDNKIHFTSQTWDTRSRIRYYTKVLSGRAGVDYDLSSNTSIGLQYIGSVSQPDNLEKTVTEIFGPATLDSLLITKAPTDKKVYYHSLNAHFKTAFDTIGRAMTIDLDYFEYHNNPDRMNVTRSYLADDLSTENSTAIFRNISDQIIKTLTLGVDVEYPSRYIDLNFGGKATYISNLSDVEAYDLNNPGSVLNQLSNFRYKERTQALYFSADKSIKKWELKFGLRYEMTQIEGYSLSLQEKNLSNYNKLFPTAYITYNANENSNYSLSYGKRINRPGFSSLNPFRWYSNPYSYTEGNPFLQPSFTDNFELAHIFKNNLNTSLYVSLTKNGSDQITLTDDVTNIQATVRRNFLEEQAIGLTQSYTFSPYKWLQSYLQYDLSYLKIKSQLPNTIAQQEGLNFYTSVNNSVFFNERKTILGELSFWYSAPSVSGVDEFYEKYSVDLGFKWLMFQKALQLNLSISDVFKTNRSMIRSFVNNIRQDYNNYYDNRQLRVTLVYKFGNDKIKSKRKEFSNEEERSRTD